jgi:hypothetical protein
MAANKVVNELANKAAAEIPRDADLFNKRMKLLPS